MKRNLIMSILLVSILLPVSAIKVDAQNVVVDSLKKTTGAVVGVGLGPAIGGLRGFTKGWLWGTEKTAEALGDPSGVPQRLVGYTTGGILTAAAGGVSGVLMGAYDGIKYGIDSPYSPESISWGSYSDYEPFTW